MQVLCFYECKLAGSIQYLKLQKQQLDLGFFWIHKRIFKQEISRLNYHKHLLMNKITSFLFKVNNYSPSLHSFDIKYSKTEIL